MKRVLLWVLTVFVLSGVLVFFPSFGSLFFLICAVVIAPIDAWQNKLKEVRISGAIKMVLILVLFVAGVCTSETKRDMPNENPSITEAEETEQPAASPEPTATPTNSPDPTEEPTPTPEPTTEPPAETEPPAAQEPVQTETMVWIPTNGGTKYHSKSSCSNMDNPQQVTLSEAQARGFTPCGRCY